MKTGLTFSELRLLMRFSGSVASHAGRLSFFKQPPKYVAFKSAGQILTNADLIASELITSSIRKNFPDHRIISEEGKIEKSISKYCWVIDPLSGTMNFAKGRDNYGISIGFLENGIPVVGALYYPRSSKLFMGALGIGSFYKKSFLSLSKPHKIQKPSELRRMGSFEFSPSGLDNSPFLSDLVKKFNGHIAVSRSITWDILELLLGRFDFSVIPQPKLWCIAGSIPIIREAGGHVFVLGFGEDEALEFDIDAVEKRDFNLPTFVASGSDRDIFDEILGIILKHYC